MPVNPGIKKGGGGLIGDLGAALGLVGGVLLAPETAGLSLPAAAAAVGGSAAAGEAIGSKIGGIADAGIDPKTPDQANPGQQESAIARRAASLYSDNYTDPQAQLETSIRALNSPDVPPELKQQAAPILAQAYDVSKKKPRGGVIS